MSVEVSLKTIEEQLYIGHARGPCSYLSDRDSALLFLEGMLLGNTYRLLLDQGYRRHGMHLYRPDCGPCRECQIIRIPVQDWKPSRSQRRVWKKGQKAFDVRIAPPEATQEKVELYSRYLKFQHERNKDTEEDDLESYENFFVDSFLFENTHELQLYYEGRLVGVGIFDTVLDVVSAVYFFFTPEVAHLSPGTFHILCLLFYAKERGAAYFYPGYYIKNCASMSYKARFRPYQIRRVGESHWEKFWE